MKGPCLPEIQKSYNEMDWTRKQNGRGAPGEANHAGSDAVKDVER